MKWRHLFNDVKKANLENLGHRTISSATLRYETMFLSASAIVDVLMFLSQCTSLSLGYGNFRQITETQTVIVVLPLAKHCRIQLLKCLVCSSAYPCLQHAFLAVTDSSSPLTARTLPAPPPRSTYYLVDCLGCQIRVFGR